MLPKRGSTTGEMIMFLFYSFVILVMALFVVSEVSFLVNQRSDVSGLTFGVYSLRTLFSPDCLAYQDIRAHPGVVDVTHFTSLYLDSCLMREGFGARLTLSSEDDERVAYIHQESYDLLHPLCFDDAYACTTVTHPVLIREGDVVDPGVLTLDLVFDRGVSA